MSYKLYKITTTEKKMVYTSETWTRGSDIFEIEETWRWGEAVIRVDDADEFDVESVKENANGFILDDYDVTDRDLNDGVSLDFNVGVEDLREEIEALWDEGAYSSIEEAGFDLYDASCTFYGELSVEKVGEGD